MKECSAFIYLQVFYLYFELHIALRFILGLSGNVCKFNRKLTGNYLPLTVFYGFLSFLTVLIKLLFVYVFSSIITLSDTQLSESWSPYHKHNKNLTTVCFSHHTLGLFCQVWCHLAWLRSCQCESVTPLLPSFPLSVFQPLSSSCLFCHCDVTWLILLKFLSASVFENSLLCSVPRVLWASLSPPADVSLCVLPYLPKAPTSANKMLPHKMSEKWEVKVSHFPYHSMFLNRLLFISDATNQWPTWPPSFHNKSVISDYIGHPTVERSTALHFHEHKPIHKQSPQETTISFKLNIQEEWKPCIMHRIILTSVFKEMSWLLKIKVLKRHFTAMPYTF